MKYSEHIFLLFLVILVSGCANGKPKAAKANFVINRGINIANWLASSELRGEQRARVFTAEDIDKLASYGFDHLRLPVEEEQMFTENGQIDRESMDLVHRTIRQCEARGMRVVFDLHFTNSHHINKEKILWTSKDAQKRMVWMWKQFLAELEQYHVDSLAYEPLNEPVAQDDDDWNKVATKIIKAIRKVNKKRVIILGSNRWNYVERIKKLEVPKDDPNIILSFHFYEPLVLTHYRAGWSSLAKLRLNRGLSYPGKPFSDLQYYELSAQDKKLVKPYYKEYNKERFRKQWQGAIAFAKAKGLKLYLGEFGCLPYCGENNREAWLRDVVSLCQEYDIAFSLWEYNSIFGFAERGSGRVKYPMMLKILFPVTERET